MTPKEALENIKDILDECFEGINPTEKVVAYCYVKDIETALNRLEELEKENESLTKDLIKARQRTCWILSSFEDY